MTMTILTSIAILLGVYIFITYRISNVIKSNSKMEDSLKSIDKQITSNSINIENEENIRKKIQDEKDSSKPDSDFFNKR